MARNGKSSQVRPIVLLSAAAFASSATTRIADPLLPLIAEEFATGVASASVVATGYSLAYGICQIIYGPVGDRLGKYWVVTVMTLLSAVATGMAAFAGSLSMLGFMRLLSGGTAAALIPLAMAYIGDNVAYEERQTVLARFLSGHMIGAIAGQACGGALGEWLGWRGVFVALAIVYVVVGLGLWNEIRAGRARVSRQAVKMLDLLAGIPELFASARVRAVVLTVFCEGFLFFGAFAFVGAFIRSAYGASFTVIGALLGAFGVGALLYSASAPKLLALLGQRGMVVAGGTLLAFAFTAIALRPPLFVLAVPTTLCGFGLFLFHNTLQTHATQMAPKVRGMAVSLFAAGFFLGQAAGVATGGVVVTAFGFPTLFVTTGFLVMALSLHFRRHLTMLEGAAKSIPSASL